MLSSKIFILSRSVLLMSLMVETLKQVLKMFPHLLSVVSMAQQTSPTILALTVSFGFDCPCRYMRRDRIMLKTLSLQRLYLIRLQWASTLLKSLLLQSMDVIQSYVFLIQCWTLGTSCGRMHLMPLLTLSYVGPGNITGHDLWWHWQLFCLGLIALVVSLGRITSCSKHCPWSISFNWKVRMLQ